jgi:hypothetical protein
MESLTSFLPYFPAWILPYLPFLLQFGMLVTVYLVLATFGVSAIESLVGNFTESMPVGLVLQYTIMDYFLLSGSVIVSGMNPASNIFWIVLLFLVAHLMVKVTDDDLIGSKRTYAQRKKWLSLGLLHMIILCGWWILAVSVGVPLVLPTMTWIMGKVQELFALPYAVGPFLSVLGVAVVLQTYIRCLFAIKRLIRIFSKHDRDELELGLH